MKKMMCILLVAVLLFLLSSCTPKETVNTSQNGISKNGPSELIRLTYLKTREEIEAFAKSDMAPSGFIMPDDLSAIGKPEQHVAYYKGYCRQFRMYVTDANNIRVDIDIVYEVQEKFWDNADSKSEIINVSDGMTSMQYIEQQRTSLILRGDNQNVGYFYVQGWLDAVFVYIDDVEITIEPGYPHGKENPYPEGQAETFYTGLLSLSDDVAMEAVGELEAAIFARWDGKERIPSSGNWLIPAGIGLGAVVVVVTGIVFWKKKKRKATVNKADKPTTEPQLQPADPLE